MKKVRIIPVVMLIVLVIVNLLLFFNKTNVHAESNADNTVVSCLDGKNITITVERGVVTLNNCTITTYEDGTVIYNCGDFACKVSNNILTISNKYGASEMMTTFTIVDDDNKTF